jgi:crotonobetainyl-CoA:carnitine CoA-transferase CaiB-like acyl-CoA transferase
MAHSSEPKGALHGLRVLDLSRILAGPTATQLLGDLGAEVIKVERPGRGDDTRGWGPPFVKDKNGRDTKESAYYLSANRNKSSLAVDIADPRGQAIIRKLAEKCDIVIENFKVGDLARYGLDYASLSKINPRLVYCSISGFGQTGPNAHRAGYDFLAQGEGGLISLTGHADGDPVKAGVAVADVICGLYAANGILAAIHARHRTGRGQYIDLGLIDAQIALLINQGVAHLTDGRIPQRRGNDHPTIVPYGMFRASDENFTLAIGNDEQFARFVKEAGAPELANDERYATNVNRVRNRDTIIPLISTLTIRRKAKDWLSTLEKLGVPAGPVNNVGDVFASDQVKARDMKVQIKHPTAGEGHVAVIGNPLKLSDTPVTYNRAPPLLGEDTDRILKELGMADDEIDQLQKSGVIG